MSTSANKGRIGGYLCIDEHGNLINNMLLEATLPPSLSCGSVKHECSHQRNVVDKNGFSATVTVYGELTDDEIIQMVKRRIGGSQIAFANRKITKPCTYQDFN